MTSYFHADQIATWSPICKQTSLSLNSLRWCNVHEQFAGRIFPPTRARSERVTDKIHRPVTGTCCDRPRPNRRTSPQVDRGLTARGACRPSRPNRPKGARGHHLGSPWPAHAAFPNQAPVPTEGTVSRAPRSHSPRSPRSHRKAFLVVHAHAPPCLAPTRDSLDCASRPPLVDVHTRISSFIQPHRRRFLGRRRGRRHAPPLPLGLVWLLCARSTCAPKNAQAILGSGQLL